MKQLLALIVLVGCGEPANPFGPDPREVYNTESKVLENLDAEIDGKVKHADTLERLILSQENLAYEYGLSKNIAGEKESLAAAEATRARWRKVMDEIEALMPAHTAQEKRVAKAKEKLGLE